MVQQRLPACLLTHTRCPPNHPTTHLRRAAGMVPAAERAASASTWSARCIGSARRGSAGEAAAPARADRGSPGLTAGAPAGGHAGGRRCCCRCCRCCCCCCWVLHPGRLPPCPPPTTAPAAATRSARPSSSATCRRTRVRAGRGRALCEAGRTGQLAPRAGPRWCAACWGPPSRMLAGWRRCPAEAGLCRRGCEQQPPLSALSSANLCSRRTPARPSTRPRPADGTGAPPEQAPGGEHAALLADVQQFLVQGGQVSA